MVSRVVSNESSSSGSSLGSSPAPANNLPVRNRVLSATLASVPEHGISDQTSSDVLQTPLGRIGPVLPFKGNTPPSDEAQRHVKYIKTVLRSVSPTPVKRRLCHEYLHALENSTEYTRHNLLEAKFRAITQHVEHRQTLSAASLETEQRLEVLMRTYMHAEFGDWLPLDANELRKTIREQANKKLVHLRMNEWIEKLHAEVQPTGEEESGDRRELVGWEIADWEDERDSAPYHAQVKAACAELDWDHNLALFVLRQYNERNKLVHKDLQRLIVDGKVGEFTQIIEQLLDIIPKLFTAEDQAKAKLFAQILERHRNEWFVNMGGEWTFKLPVIHARREVAKLTFTELKRVARLPDNAERKAIEKVIASIRKDRDFGEKQKAHAVPEVEQLRHRNKELVEEVAEKNLQLAGMVSSREHLVELIEELEHRNAALVERNQKLECRVEVLEERIKWLEGIERRFEELEREFSDYRVEHE